MTIWRPRDHIQVKIIGLLIRERRLLAARVFNDAGALIGVRPLGGTVAFGETWRDALIREFAEELDIVIRVVGEPVVLENLYRHEGHTGHEVMFVARVEIVAGSVPTEGPFNFIESDESEVTADWFDLDVFDHADGPVLFPTGLNQHLEALAA